MNKFLLYKITFSFSLVLFCLLALFNIDIANVITTLLFFAASIYAVFSFDTLPIKHFKVPEVYRYYKDRNSNFAYLITGYLIIATVLITLVSINTNLSYGALSLILWAILIMIRNIYHSQWFVKKVLVNQIVNYILENVDKNIDKSKIEIIVKQAIEKGGYDAKIIDDLSIENKKKVFVFLKAYLQTININLTSKEIEILNSYE